MQFPGDITQGGFLRGNEFLRKLAAAFRDFRQSRKEAAIPADQGQSVENDREKRDSKQKVNLTLNAVVDLDNALPGLLLVFAVLHQKTGDGRAESGLPFLQGQL